VSRLVTVGIRRICDRNGARNVQMRGATCRTPTPETEQRKERQPSACSQRPVPRLAGYRRRGERPPLGERHRWRRVTRPPSTAAGLPSARLQLSRLLASNALAFPNLRSSRFGGFVSNHCRVAPAGIALRRLIPN
jgi:hypothetical protein